MEADVLKIIATRENIDYTLRKDQIATNILGWKGGQPYIAARLSRFAGESKIDWEGGKRDLDSSIITGRKSQAHCVPHLNRIVEKINQYVLGVAPTREGLDKSIEDKITVDGKSVNGLMKEVSSLITVARYCWIGIDVPAIGNPISIAEKQSLNIRPFWRVYSPLEVIDWYFDGLGELEWLITQGTEYIAKSPYEAPVIVKIRRLWEKGKVTKFTFDPKSEEKITSEEEVELSLQGRVPFVLVNEISPEPWSFDNLESINRTILDLESVSRQNYFNSVFPQLYLPSSVLDNIMGKYDCNAEAATSKLMSWSYPILCDKDDIQPGFIMPDASSLVTIREEIKSLRSELYDAVGLALQAETKQVASADAKAWDFLDIEMVMKERAEILQEAEQKCVNISKAWDKDFPEYTPIYNKKFSISNIKEEMETLIMAGNVSMPDEMTKMILRKMFNKLTKGDELSKEETQKVLDSIDVFTSTLGVEWNPSKVKETDMGNK